jgi:hypothetical protein
MTIADVGRKALLDATCPAVGRAPQPTGNWPAPGGLAPAFLNLRR